MIIESGRRVGVAGVRLEWWEGGVGLSGVRIESGRRVGWGYQE